MKNIPKIGLGTYKLLGDKCYNLVREALDLGYRHIDTAQIYDNENYIGKSILNSGIIRSEIYLTTKVWVDKFESSKCRKSVEESLKNLKTDYVDLLLMHWPHKESDYKIHKETLTEMLKLKSEGKVINIGVSNFNVDLLDDAIDFTGGQIYTNQVEYHVNLDQSKMLEFCNKNNIFLTAYSPFAHGHIFSDKKLISIANKYSKKVSQIALKWLTMQKNIVAIPKSSSKEHLIDNLDLNNFELDSDDLNIIAGLPKKYRYFDFDGLSPDWD